VGDNERQTEVPSTGTQTKKKQTAKDNSEKKIYTNDKCYALIGKREYSMSGSLDKSRKQNAREKRIVCQLCPFHQKQPSPKTLRAEPAYLC